MNRKTADIENRNETYSLCSHQNSFLDNAKVKDELKITQDRLRRSTLVIKRKFFSAGGVKSTTANLLIATLGPGMLAIPTAFRKSGLVWGFLQFILSAFISWLSMFCLVRNPRYVFLQNTISLKFYLNYF